MIGIAAVLIAVLLAVWLGSRGDDTPSDAASQAPSKTPSRTPSQTPTPTETPSKTPSQTPTETPSETTPEPATVEVDPAAYVGRTVKDVEKELAGLGLVPTTAEVDNPGDAEKDTVVDVSPSGTLVEGDPVTISFYGKPPKGTPNGKGTG